jgi:cellobiose phosphorylase
VALTYRFEGATYTISVRRAADQAAGSVVLNGALLPDDSIPLDGQAAEHRVEVYLAVASDTPEAT